MVEPRILVAEDDLELRDLLLAGLRRAGFDAAGVGTGSDLLARTSSWAPHALIVDVGLPDADGRDVCQALRAAGSQVPVLFLTALDTRADRLAGFGAGGDDYVTKPFDFAEVVARIRALLRRADAPAAIEAGGLRLDPATHAAHLGEQGVTLTPTEFRLLAALAARPGEAVRRRTLIAAAWPDGAIVHDNTLDVYVARLRRKLAGIGADQTIANVYGVGFTLR
ncbi:MAG TPA: response regulator transcription factor [Conexibacter sp.]|jgi:two-component system OmpR family response regulator|nr:response regulator transcription factor [Conexibacter sp.]